MYAFYIYIAIWKNVHYGLFFYQNIVFSDTTKSPFVSNVCYIRYFVQTLDKAV